MKKFDTPDFALSGTPKMPLTRNLYVEDEVIAAFQLCVLRGRVIEAVFWAQELLESQMTAEFLKALKEIWLLGFGIGALGWYMEFRAFEAEETLDADEAVRLVVTLCKTGLIDGHDTSYLILAGTRLGPEQVDFCIVPRGVTGVNAFFAAAVLQGRTITAWRALPQVDTLQAVAEYKHGSSGIDLLKLYDEFPAIVVAGLCLPRGKLMTKVKTSSDIPSEVQEAVKYWETLQGRARRIYTIPYDALYWITARGKTSVYDSSDKQLCGSLERTGKLWGSVYWDSVVEDIGGWLAIRRDSDVRETFYETHFPDDIPDEWSKEDRGKSHGNGCLQPGGAVSIQRFLNTWFGRYRSEVIWGEFDSAIRNIHAESLGDISAIIGEPVALNLERKGVKRFALQ